LESWNTAHVLVVANGTVATPALLDAIRERAEHEPVQFHLLVPAWSLTGAERRHKIDEAELVLELSLPLMEEAAGSQVEGSWSIRHDPMDAIEDALRSSHFDEIILLTAPHAVARRFHVDLPHRVAHLGLPVTVVSDAGRGSGGRRQDAAAHNPT
jgi:hypothetical protein